MLRLLLIAAMTAIVGCGDRAQAPQDLTRQAVEERRAKPPEDLSPEMAAANANFNSKAVAFDKQIDALPKASRSQPRYQVNLDDFVDAAKTALAAPRNDPDHFQADFITEQVVIGSARALRKGEDPRLVAKALTSLNEAVVDPDKKKALELGAKLVGETENGKKPSQETLTKSTAFLDEVWSKTKVAVQTVQTSQRYANYVKNIGTLLEKGEKVTARKLMEQFRAEGKAVEKGINSSLKSVGLKGEKVAKAVGEAVPWIIAGVKIAILIDRWGDASDLEKISMSLDAATSLAVAGQVFCTAVPQVAAVKGTVILLAYILQAVLDIGLDLGLGGGRGSKANGGGEGKGGDGGGEGGHGGEGTSGKPGDGRKGSSADSNDDGSSPAEQAANAQGADASPEDIGRAVAKAVGGGDSVEKAATDAARKAKEEGRNPAEAAATDPAVEAAEEKQNRKDDETAKQAAEKSGDKPAAKDLADKAVAADPTLASDKERLQELIGEGLLRAERREVSVEDAVRESLRRLRVERAKRDASSNRPGTPE